MRENFTSATLLTSGSVNHCMMKAIQLDLWMTMDAEMTLTLFANPKSNATFQMELLISLMVMCVNLILLERAVQSLI